jgi:tetratricopeptide (TPR) repeat protein
MVRTIRKNSIIICFITFFAFAGNDEELFLRANKLYESHEYDQALSLYQMMPKQGRAVLYNIGNCYFHKNDYAQALIYWMRAKNGATVQECAAIDHNREYVLQKLNKKQDKSLGNHLVQLTDTINLYLSLLGLQLLIILLWITLVCLYYYNRLKKMHCFLLITLLLIFISALFFQYIKKITVCGFIVKEAQVFVCPDESSDIIGKIDYADSVIIKEIRKGWYKVRYSGNIGWVEADAVQTV